MWSLPPKAWPISVREAWVSWRARYIAICRGKAMALARFFAGMSDSLMPKNSADLSLDVLDRDELRVLAPEVGEDLLGELSYLAAGQRAEGEHAVSEPSSSRTLVLMRSARK